MSCDTDTKLNMSNPNYFKHFVLNWETDYFFRLYSSTSSQCMICHKIYCNRFFSLKRHYETFHKSTYEALDSQGRQCLVASLKSNFPSISSDSGSSGLQPNSQINSIHPVDKTFNSKNMLKATFVASYELVSR